YVHAWHPSRHAAAGERCQVRVRMPYAGKGQRLRVHRVWKALNSLTRGVTEQEDGYVNISETHTARSSGDRGRSCGEQSPAASTCARGRGNPGRRSDWSRLGPRSTEFAGGFRQDIHEPVRQREWRAPSRGHGRQGSSTPAGPWLAADLVSMAAGDAGTSP